MAVETKTFLFNKNNGELIGELPSGAHVKGLDGTQVMTKVVNFDPKTHFWAGGWNGGLQAIADAVVDKNQVIEEDLLDINVADNIGEQYPIFKQLNIIADMLNQSEVPNTPEFTAMMEYINNERERNKARKEVYQQSDTPYTYISKEDIKLMINKRLGKN